MGITVCEYILSKQKIPGILSLLLAKNQECQIQEERLAPVKFVENLKESLEMVREVIFSLQFNSEGSNEDLMRTAALEAEKRLAEPIKVFSAML